MSEKRFTFADGFKIVAIRDNGEIMNSVRVCDKLNELYEENEQLKKENNELKQQLSDIDKLINDLGSEEMCRQYDEIIGDFE